MEKSDLNKLRNKRIIIIVLVIALIISFSSNLLVLKTIEPMIKQTKEQNRDTIKFQEIQKQRNILINLHLDSIIKSKQLYINSH